MVKCEICKREFKNLKSISYHLSIHKISPENYYLLYLGNKQKCANCNNPTNFLTLEKGYRKFCSTLCVSQSKVVKEKRKKTMLNRYGVNNPAHSKELIEKRKQTMIDRYGVEYPFQSNEVKEKIKQTYLKKYGVDHSTKSKLVKEKMKKTMLNRYGVEYASQSEDIKEKKRQTCLIRYGVECNLQLIEVKEKIKQTNLELYGMEYPAQSDQIKEKIKNTWNNKFFQILINSSRLNFICTPNFNIDDYQGVDHKYSWTCTKCQTRFEDNLKNGKIPRCPICYPKIMGISLGEIEVTNFIKSLEMEFTKGDHSVLGRKELDIYIPSHNLAIEYNGIYWHSDLNGKYKNYHLDKTLKCKEKGIQLIHIFEDEWIDKQEIVKSIIRAKLGKIENRIYARKCIIKSVPNDEAKLFLFDNHLQGPINGTHIGLYYNNKLVSLLVYDKSRFNKNYEYEILRFCNKINTSIVGGLSKLLKQIDSKSVITYADLRYGTGDSYLKCGFTYKTMTSPSYFYFISGDTRRFNRLNFQKHLLQDKLDIFDPTLTEWQNMQLNGYDRIWDCGCNVFSRKLTPSSIRTNN